MYIHVLFQKKKIYFSFSLIFSSSLFNTCADDSSITITSSKSLFTFVVATSRMLIPASVSEIAVSRLSFRDVVLFTNFFNSSLSMILGTFEFFSIILQATSRTHICSGYLPFKIRKTLNCSWVKPCFFNSLLVIVFNHHAVYKIFKPALCTSFLNFVLFIACSNFTMQMYVYTCNFKS